MFRDIVYLFFLIVLWAVDSWGVCSTQSYPSNSSPSLIRGLYFASTSGCNGTTCGTFSTCEDAIGSWTPSGLSFIAYTEKYGGTCYYISNSSQCGGCASGNYRTCHQEGFFCRVIACSSLRESDSLKCIKSGNLFMNDSCCDQRCVCENDGGQWNDQTNTCSPPCNAYTNLHQECVSTWNSGYSQCEGLNCTSGGYWQLNIMQCYYDSCAMAKVCTEGSSFPAGNLTCDDWNDQDTTTQQNCVASMGHECVIGCPDHKTIVCDCDGSCDHAKSVPACQCSPPSSPSSSASSSPSSSASSSDSAESSNSGVSSSNNDNPIFSSGSGGNVLDNALLGQIEYNTRKTKENTLASTGYLSSIDRWQSTHNLNMIAQQKQLVAIESAASEASKATKEQIDTLHNTNSILSDIKDFLFDDTTNYDFSFTNTWSDSVKNHIDSLKNKIAHGVDSIPVDSLKSDTSQYKSKFSSLFLSNAQTRNGCYEFKYKKPTGSGSFASKMKDVVIDFGNVGGFFDMCSIGRGLVRCCGAIFVIITMIVSYKMSFKGGE